MTKPFVLLVSVVWVGLTVGDNSHASDNRSHGKAGVSAENDDAALPTMAHLVEELYEPMEAGKPHMSYRPMADERFWEIIHSIPEEAQDPDDRITHLRSALEKLSLEDLIGFEKTFRRLLNQAYSWDLWGAAYIVHGGCSDDGFEYFRRWLVSRGREVYENSLANPDSLADLNLDPTGPEGSWEFEEIYYVTMEVFDAKGGEGDIRDYADLEAGMDGSEPSGSPFAEDESHLRQRYPKLWQRFGNSPLPAE